MPAITASGTTRDKQNKSYVDSPQRGSNFTAQEVYVGNTSNELIPVDNALLKTPHFLNLSVANKNTKQTVTIEENCKYLKVQAKDKVTLIKYSFNESEFDSGNTHTIYEGQVLELKNLLLSGKTLYFSTGDDNRNIEVQQWT